MAATLFSQSRCRQYRQSRIWNRRNLDQRPAAKHGEQVSAAFRRPERLFYDLGNDEAN